MTLATYLNDHLAGAAGGVQLAAKLDERFRSTSRGTTFERLHREIEEDLASLQGIMRTVDVTPNRVMQAMGWVGEKATRIKLNEVTGRRGLAPLLEMEALGSGVQGKLSLWQNLRGLGAVEPRLAGVGLDELVRRAEEQLDALTRERTQFAAEVLHR